MKKLTIVATVICLSQAPSLEAGNPILDTLKKWSIGKGENLATNTAEKIVRTFLPEDIVALTNGNVLTMQNGTWTQVTATNLQGAPKQYLVRLPATEPQRPKVLSRGKMILDEKIVQDKVPGKLALQVLQSPLPWNSSQRAYTTDLQVGFEVSGKASPRLDSPVTINLTGKNAELKPSKITIGKMGQDGFANISVTCDRHDAEARVILHSDFGERSFDIPVGPHTSELKMSASEKRIFGYGLGTATVTVKRLAEDGRELSDSNSLTVSLSADHGKLDSSAVTFPSGQSRAEVKVRSVGLGLARVSVESDSFKGELADLQFVFPFGFIASALAGGCLGGIGRYFRMKNNGMNRKSLGRLVVEGCVVGFLIVAGVAAGVVVVQLPTTVIGTELGALVIATAGGYTGAPMLDKIKAVFNPPGRNRPQPA